jgi:hypothetical protein
MRNGIGWLRADFLFCHAQSEQPASSAGRQRVLVRCVGQQILAEVNDALDNFCNSSGLVAARRCFVVHTGRIHPHIARDRTCGAADPAHLGSKSRVIAAAGKPERRMVAYE